MSELQQIWIGAMKDCVRRRDIASRDLSRWLGWDTTRLVLLNWAVDRWGSETVKQLLG